MAISAFVSSTRLAAQAQRSSGAYFSAKAPRETALGARSPRTHVAQLVRTNATNWASSWESSTVLFRTKRKCTSDRIASRLELKPDKLLDQF